MLRGFLAILGFASVTAAHALTFTVDTLIDDTDAHDVSPGDGVCADSFGFCTLRAAIEESNARSGAGTASHRTTSAMATVGPTCS